MSEQTKTIGGVTYAVRHLPPDDAILLSEDLVRVGGDALIAALVKVVGPELLGELSGDGDGDAEPAPLAGRDPKELIEGIGQVLGGLVGRYDGKRWLRLTEAMMRVTSADGKPLSYEGGATWKLHFQGRMGDLRQVVIFALGVNFGGFFGVGPGTLGSAISRVTGQPTSP